MSILVYKVIKENNGIGLECSDGRKLFIDNWTDLITQLLYKCDFAVCWNIDQFISVFCSLFPKDIQEKIQQGGRVVLQNGERVFAQPSRMLAITYLGTEINFYGLSRYADEEPQTVKDLYILALKVIDAYKVFGIENPKLTSPIGAYSQVLEKLDFPRSCDLPSNSLEMVSQCSKIMTRPEWRQTYKLGHWNADEIMDADLVSAYPSIMAELPDLTNAKFYESNNIPEEASFGILLGDLNVVNKVSPFASDDGVYRKGLHKDYVITTGQYWFLKRSGGEFNIKHTWYLTLPEKVRKPFKSTMLDLFRARATDDSIVKKIAKGISVGVWGMLCQRYEKPEGGWKLGKCFNSVYGLMTSSICSTKVGYFIYGNNLQDKVVSITVDGTLIEAKIPIENTGEMGSWKVNEASPFLVLSQLYQWGSDKKPNMLKYPEMMELVNKNLKKSVIGDIDLNLIERDRIFKKLPKNFGELISNRYDSEPYEIQ